MPKVVAELYTRRYVYTLSFGKTTEELIQEALEKLPRYCREVGDEALLDAMKYHKMIDIQSVLYKVTAEVVRAYCDIHLDRFEIANEIRNLDFKASAPLPKHAAIAVVHHAINAYNEFDADCLEALPENSLVWIAREGSPAIYVMADDSEMKAIDHKILKADDCNRIKEGYWRIWWD